MYRFVGKFISSVTILFRFADQSKHDSTIAWQIDTFWCITTSPDPAPMILPTRSPTVTGISHAPAPSSQARIPRVSHSSAYCCKTVPRAVARHRAQRMADQVQRAIKNREFSAPAKKRIHRFLDNTLDTCGAGVSPGRADRLDPRATAGLALTPFRAAMLMWGRHSWRQAGSLAGFLPRAHLRLTQIAAALPNNFAGSVIGEEQLRSVHTNAAARPQLRILHIRIRQRPFAFVPPLDALISGWKLQGDAKQPRAAHPRHLCARRSSSEPAAR